jgi:uncharacterized membrane protein
MVSKLAGIGFIFALLQVVTGSTQSGFASFILYPLLGAVVGSIIESSIRRAIEDRAVQLPVPTSNPSRASPAATKAPALQIKIPELVTVADEKPKPISDFFGVVIDWFIRDNPMLKTGIVVLFIGLGFLARYTAQLGLFPPELRLTLVGLAAIAALGFGYVKRIERPNFAMPVQGLGIATLYLTVFSAAKLFGLIPVVAAFVLMTTLCGFGVLLAIMQNSLALALVSFVGGFAVPLLLASNTGNHIVLFGYYLVLNLGIFWAATLRSWRALNIVGFVATFGVATAWGVLKFSPALYLTTQPFLMAYFLVYLGIAIVFAQKSPTKLGNTVDSMLVFGNPLVAMGLQYGLTNQFEFGPAWSALAFSAVHLLAAYVLLKRGKQDDNRLLIDSFVVLGVGFLTLAIPLGLNARWTSAMWAVEGLAAFWIGMRQKQALMRLFGLVLQVIAVGSLIWMRIDTPVTSTDWISQYAMGYALLAACAMTLAHWLRAKVNISETESQLSNPAYVYGIVLVGAAILSQTSQSFSLGFLPTRWHQNMFEVVASIVVLVGSFGLGSRFAWPIARYVSLGSIFVIGYGLVSQIAVADYAPQQDWLWVLWLALFASHWFILKKADLPDQLLAMRACHAVSVWLLALYLARLLTLAIERADLTNTAWASVTLLTATVIVVFTLTRMSMRKQLVWPWAPYAFTYGYLAAAPIVLLMLVASLVVAFSSAGDASPLPFLPLINPTDLAVALAIVGALFWRNRLLTSQLEVPTDHRDWLGRPTDYLLASLTFLWLNSAWLRIAHHWLDVDWSVTALLSSFAVQAGQAILWTLISATLMIFANRRKQRNLWTVAGVLMAVVVAKLVLVDLSNSGGAERIIAFIAVGVLMLLISWLAPLPPANNEAVIKTAQDTVKVGGAA